MYRGGHGGGNVAMTEWIDKGPGLISAWYPGEEGWVGGCAVLFGEFSPSGNIARLLRAALGRQCRL